MRRLCALLIAVVLLAGCGGDGEVGTVAVSDLEALAGYLVGVLEAESALAEAIPATPATTTAQAADLARQQVAANQQLAAVVEALSPPPEAERHRATLADLATDQARLYERLAAAVEAMDLQQINAVTLDTLDLAIRGVAEVTDRQLLIAAALAAHPGRPLNQYLTEIGELWVPLTKDYQRLASDAQRKLLAGDVAGAVGPYEDLVSRFDGFLPAWDAIPPPTEATEFHTRYRQWAADGLDIFRSFVAMLRDQDLSGLQGALTQMTTWAAGVYQAVLLRNQLTLDALRAP